MTQLCHVMCQLLGSHVDANLRSRSSSQGSASTCADIVYCIACRHQQGTTQKIPQLLRGHGRPKSFLMNDPDKA